MFKKNKQVDRVLDYKQVFGTEHGKRVLYDLVKTHNVLNSTFDKDPATFAFKEGERNVVLRILTLLNVDTVQLQNIIEKGKQNEQSYL